ncbi:peptide deformylase [Candidatus Vidania fulgoroideae]|nr:peptide deformylase [Candidatus Vidania fulgoroideae]WDR79271.1 peptide deformylase [Candidatus Vidania fulgoroideae]
MKIFFPDKLLFKKSKKVKNYKKINNILRIMKKEIKNYKEYVAISSVQIGYLKRIFIVKNILNKKYYTFINPKILWKSKIKKYSYEGCISIPNFYNKILRNKEILLETYCEKKIYHKFFFKNFFSFCIQHEIDHLNGKLINMV